MTDQEREALTPEQKAALEKATVFYANNLPGKKETLSYLDFEEGFRAALAVREGPPAHEDMEKRMHEVWSNGAPVPWLRFAAIWRAAIDFAEDRHVERMAPVVAALADAKGAPTPAETEAHHVQTEWEPTDVEIKAAARGWAKRADGSDGNFHPEYVKRAMHQCARAALKAAHKANPDE